MQTPKTESDSNNAVHIGKDAEGNIIIAGSGNTIITFEVDAEKQTSVRLMAQKPGFMTWRQDATPGNTSLSFRLEKEK